MNKNWEIKKLGEIISLEYGKPLSKDDRNPNGLYPVYGANGIKNRTDKFYAEDYSIIVGRKGSAGEINYTDKKFWPLDVTYFTKFNRKLYNLDFLFHLLTFLDLPRLAKGVKPGINRNDVYSLSVRVPPLPEQKRIVAILDKAFSAIDKAKQNAEANLKNAKELFESYLQNIFENNKNWVTEKMVDCCDILTCGVASTPKYVDKLVGIPFLSAQNVKNGQIILDKYKYISREFHQKLTKKNKPSKGDILYSRVGAKFGEAGVVEHDFEFSVYVSVTLIRSTASKLNNYFLKNYLNSPIIKDLAKKSVSSSGVPNLNVKVVREFPVKYPTLKVQKEIIKEIENFSTETKKLEIIYQNKINNLEELKKSILQKAFRGEL